MNTFSFDSAATAAQPWLRETVQAFFEAVAWDGRPAPVGLGLGATATHAQSAMTMTVSAFFDSIPWNGQPVIGVPIAPLEAAPATAPSADLDLTLDGFSDLFG